ncbi:hypothetical protein [Bergeyella zoohelcum]|uniref:hypothetical protein n=1 Tax=Bergeyella zoohelcum TaxID=1015 RepID=UPI003736CA6D
MNKILFIIILLTALSCSKKQDNISINNNEIEKNAEIFIKSELGPDEYLDSVKIVQVMDWNEKLELYIAKRIYTEHYYDYASSFAEKLVKDSEKIKKHIDRLEELYQKADTIKSAGKMVRFKVQISKKNKTVESDTISILFDKNNMIIPNDVVGKMVTDKYPLNFE